MGGSDIWWCMDSARSLSTHLRVCLTRVWQSLLPLFCDKKFEFAIQTWQTSLEHYYVYVKTYFLSQLRKMLILLISFYCKMCTLPTLRSRVFVCCEQYKHARSYCWQWTHFTMGPNEQNQHFAELRQKKCLYVHVVVLLTSLPSLDGKRERFVTKKWQKWLPNSSQTDYRTFVSWAKFGGGGGGGGRSFRKHPNHHESLDLTCNVAYKFFILKRLYYGKHQNIFHFLGKISLLKEGVGFQGRGRYS